MSPADYLPVLLEDAQDTLRTLRELLRGLAQDSEALSRAVDLAHALRGMAGALKSPRFSEKAHALDSWLVSLYHQQEPLTPKVTSALLELAAGLELELLGDASANADLELQIALVSHCRLKGLRARQILDVLAGFGSLLEIRPDAASLEAERFGKDFTVRLRTAASLVEIRRRLLGIGDVASIEPYSEGSAKPAVVNSSSRVPFEQALQDLAASQGKTIAFSLKHLQLLPEILVPLVKILAKEAVSAIDTPQNRIRQGCPPQASFSLEVFQEACKLRIELAFSASLVPSEGRERKSGALGQLFAALEPHGGTSKTRTSGGMTYISIRWPHLPQSLAAMLFELNGMPFAFPLQWVEEVIDLAEHPVCQGKLFLRGEAFPVLRLQDRFDFPASQQPTVAFTVRVQGKRLGLLAERILGQKSLVPKPISRLLGPLPFLEAASILEDGRVAYWLDLPALGEVAS